MASFFKGKTTASGEDYPQTPPGNWAGVCICLIDLGTHWESFQGGPQKKQRKVLLVWEIEAEADGKDERYCVGRDYNIGMNEKGEVSYGEKSNIRKMLEGWKGRAYGLGEEIDLSAVLGKNCLVNIAEKKTSAGKDITFVNAISPLPKGMKAIKASKPQIVYSADSDALVPEEDWLPRVFGELVKDILERCLEHKGSGIREAKPAAGAGKAPTTALAAHQQTANDADAF